MPALLENLFGAKMYTIQYPRRRRDYSHRFRGHHILTTGRRLGALRRLLPMRQACPAECTRSGRRAPGRHIEKYPVVYEIDMLRCISAATAWTPAPKRRSS